MTTELTTESFKEKVFDFEQNQEWDFKGGKPAIIDFWAPWCQPCKMVSPVLEDISEEYSDQVDVYKINVDDEGDLAGMFQIQSIPSILFIPMNEKPQMAVGAVPKDQLKQAMNDVLGIEPAA